MTMEPGTRLGPYEVVAPIGAGGMGEVYRARDTRLGRDVAIKVLPAELAQNAELKARFEREARAISQMEHPNICRLYDVGDGYLVMELLDGETLAERLLKGPLPTRDVVKYGVQIAAAVDRAHRRGIIHRDLKPGNVMLTKSGAKLLDFGLARPAPSMADLAVSDSVTAQAPLTREGAVVGTCAYMSPEQVRGAVLDARSDVFSLGIVLYEMLSGRRPFAASSPVGAMHAVLENAPPELDGNVPPAVAQIVERCLEKDPDDRFHSAGDVAFALTALAPSSGPTAATNMAQQRPRRWMWPALAALLLIIAAVASSRLWRTKPSPTTGGDVTRFQISFPPESPLVVDDISGDIAISPDGKTLAYVRRTAESSQLYIRPLSSLEDTGIDGTTGATSPFFSPDGKSVGFGAANKLKRLRLADRQVVTLGDSGRLAGGSWGTDGTIVYASAVTGTLFRIPESGGDAREITRRDKLRHETWHSRPQLLPDRRTVLFLSVAGFGTDSMRRVEALDLGSGKRRVVATGGAATGDVASQLDSFQWSSAGVLLFGRRNRLYAVRFDPMRGAAEGEPVVVVDPVSALPFAIADDGTLVYYSPDAAGANLTRLMRVTAPGSEQPLGIPPGRYRTVALSPDERQLAMTIDDDNRRQIAIADLSRGTVTALSGDGVGHIPVWMPESDRVVYSWTGGGPSNLVSRRADGSDQAERLVTSPNHQDPGSISPDRRWLAYAEHDPATNWDIWLVPLTGAHTPQPYLRTAAAEFSPAIAPKGRLIAYVVAATDDNPQLFIAPFQQSGHRTFVSEGAYPLWSRDGNTLYFYNRLKIFAAGVAEDGTVARPRILVDDLIPVGGGFGQAPYAVFKDGSLLIVRGTSTPSLTVVTHWAGELEQLMKSASHP